MTYSIDSNDLPNNAARNLQGYSRSLESTGLDLIIKPLNDIQTTDTGDFALVSGADLIQTALIRLLHTPPYGYGRWVRTKTGISFVGGDYQNPMYSYLSSPNSLANKAQVENELKQTLNKETRIEVISVVINNSGTFESININVTYRMKGESELKQIRAELINDYVYS